MRVLQAQLEDNDIMYQQSIDISVLELIVYRSKRSKQSP